MVLPLPDKQCTSEGHLKQAPTCPVCLSKHEHEHGFEDAKGIFKTSKLSFQDLQQALATAELKVHASTIRKRRCMFQFLVDVQEEETFGLFAGIMYFDRNGIWTTEQLVTVGLGTE